MGLGILLFVAAALEIAGGQPFAAVWLAVIALFIFQGARASERQIGLTRRLAEATVADAMDPPPPAVPADMTLSEALDRYLRGHEEEAFPVVEAGRVLGMVSFSSARRVGAHDPLRPVRDALIPLSQVIVAHPDERLGDVAGRLGAGRAALVLRDGELVGAITGGGVYRWATSGS
jgi:CBS domain-containing protein